MDKSKISTKTIVRYIRDFSIVVAGIAVTLYVNYQVTNRSEKRDLKLYLNDIKLELEENNRILDKTIEDLEPSVKYSAYLMSHDKKSLNKDTLESYNNAYYSASIPSFKTNAFEMFKNSGAMRLMDNKELLLSLWDVYDEFRSVTETFDWFIPAKWEDIKKEVILRKDGQEVKIAPMYNFYILDIPSQMLRPCERALKKSKEMVSKLENAKMIKQ